MDNESINVKIEESEGRRRKKTEKNKSGSFSFRNIGSIINAWRVNDRKQGTVDLPFFFIVTILLVLGIIMMFSASYAWAISEGYPGTYYAQRQIMFAFAGLAAMYIFSRVNYHIFFNRGMALGIYAVSLFMLLLVKFTPLGQEHNEARRWLGFKGGFEFQPSEVMKFSIIILFSFMLVISRKRMKDYKTGIVPFLIFLAPVVYLLMKQPHLSCTILICLISIVLIYIGGARTVHLLATGLAGVLIIALGVVYKIRVEGFTYFTNRFQSWLHPFSDPTGVTWQTDQSLIAIGSGGFFGMGLGNSRQKFLYLPESKNDFVFSIICEELGYVGAITVILLFAFFIFRGFYIASKAPDRFGMLVCIGLTAQVGFQAFLNIAVVSNLIPNTGISLPFFSYGGTSIMMLLGQVGIVLNISRQMTDSSDEKKVTERNSGHRSQGRRSRTVSEKNNERRVVSK